MTAIDSKVTTMLDRAKEIIAAAEPFFENSSRYIVSPGHKPLEDEEFAPGEGHRVFDVIIGPRANGQSLRVENWSGRFAFGFPMAVKVRYEIPLAPGADIRLTKLTSDDEVQIARALSSKLKNPLWGGAVYRPARLEPTGSVRFIEITPPGAAEAPTTGPYAGHGNRAMHFMMTLLFAVSTQTES